MCIRLLYTESRNSTWIQIIFILNSTANIFASRVIWKKGGYWLCIVHNAKAFRFHLMKKQNVGIKSQYLMNHFE